MICSVVRLRVLKSKQSVDISLKTSSLVLVLLIIGWPINEFSRCEVLLFMVWCIWRDLNPRPLPPEGNALSTELQMHGREFYSYFTESIL